MPRRTPAGKGSTPAPVRAPAPTPIPVPVPAVRVCARCLRETADAVLVEWIDTGSGPGVEVWTCPQHVRGYDPDRLS
ncbi:hypothetical protein ACWD5R_21195 [Streptomyces sp. NPDC002514]|uniref:hypothetical protein n=1 Tax=unclassified Streptomyces TaxID=2593676 RepID=UPI0036B4F0B1